MSAGGCPVEHKGPASPPPATWRNAFERWGLVGKPDPEVTSTKRAERNDGCAVQHDEKPGTYNPLTGDERFGQQRAPGQSQALSTQRTVSSIPKPEGPTPEHQPEGATTWVYPSEQQYYNAMRRKGWDARESDVPVVVAIHNAVNEQGWTRVKEWEQLRGRAVGGDPMLEQFRGRPNDVSPKAWLKTNLLGYAAPFDRHDWIVRRGGGGAAGGGGGDGGESSADGGGGRDEEGSVSARYVIDFYAGKPTPDKPVALHLDVRPALDSLDAAVLRVRMFHKETVAPLLHRAASAFAVADDVGGSSGGGGPASPDEPPGATSAGQR